jgi:hypothetical protein
MLLVVAVVGSLFGALAIYSKTPETLELSSGAVYTEMSGMYSDNRGGTLYIEVDDAGRLEGFYEQGATFGEVYGRFDGMTLTGFWLEDSAPMTCTNERHGAETWGRLRWTFAEDFGFVGAFNYCGAEPSGNKPWSGIRAAGR